MQNTPAEPQAPKELPLVPVTEEIKQIAAEVLTAEEWFNFIEEMTGERGQISALSFEIYHGGETRNGRRPMTARPPSLQIKIGALG